jgi:hypothetical protein
MKEENMADKAASPVSTVFALVAKVSSTRSCNQVTFYEFDWHRG